MKGDKSYIGGEPTLGYPAEVRAYRPTNVAHRETSVEASEMTQRRRSLFVLWAHDILAYFVIIIILLCVLTGTPLLVTFSR
jgi:hypothetical protein